MQDYGEWGGSVILVQHNLIIIPLAEYNFKHNTLVSRVMPESIILYFWRTIRQNLNLGVNNRGGKKSRQGKARQKKKNTVPASTVRCRMIGKQVSSLLAEALISGLLPGGGTWRKKTIFTQQISLRKHCTECNGIIGQIATPRPI